MLRICNSYHQKATQQKAKKWCGFILFPKTRKEINKPYLCGFAKSGDDGNGPISDWHVDGWRLDE